MDPGRMQFCSRGVGGPVLVPGFQADFLQEASRLDDVFELKESSLKAQLTQFGPPASAEDAPAQPVRRSRWNSAAAHHAAAAYELGGAAGGRPSPNKIAPIAPRALQSYPVEQGMGAAPPPLGHFAHEDMPVQPNLQLPWGPPQPPMRRSLDGPLLGGPGHFESGDATRTGLLRHRVLLPSSPAGGHPPSVGQGTPYWNWENSQRPRGAQAFPLSTTPISAPISAPISKGDLCLPFPATPPGVHLPRHPDAGVQQRHFGGLPPIHHREPPAAVLMGPHALEPVKPEGEARNPLEMLLKRCLNLDKPETKARIWSNRDGGSKDCPGALPLQTRAAQPCTTLAEIEAQLARSAVTPLALEVVKLERDLVEAEDAGGSDKGSQSQMQTDSGDSTATGTQDGTPETARVDSLSVGGEETNNENGGLDFSDDDADNDEDEVEEEPEAASGSCSSGRLLLLLLKGTRQLEQKEGAAGALPSNFCDEKWEPLLQPFLEVSHAKRFVGADLFRPGNGLVVSGSGAQPCVLKDLPESDLLVMYKPSGWATCSTPQWEGIEGNMIRWVWQRSDCQQAAPCHRLDRGTSGVVVVAKSRNSLRHICSQISGRTLVKQYFGLCRGKIDPPQGALSIPLAVSAADKPLGACVSEGRQAITRYRVLGYFTRANSAAGGSDIYSLVQLQIDHGRQHQIRLHMSSMGHPVVYDAKYDPRYREDAKVTTRLFLHAAYLRCTQPNSHSELAIACRLPPQLQRALTGALVRAREMEQDLSAEAMELCDCLLASDKAEESHFEARLAARRRDELLCQLNLSTKEKEEIMQTLHRLPTPEERSSVLVGFRAESERPAEEDISVPARFDRFVTEFLAAKVRAEGASGTTESSTKEGSSKGKPSPLEEIDAGAGPVSFNTEYVMCEVCGLQEKVESVQFPALNIRLCCRTAVAPMAEPLRRLLEKAAATTPKGAMPGTPGHLKIPPSEAGSERCQTTKSSSSWSLQPQPPSPYAARDVAERVDDAQDEEALSKELILFLKENGRQLPGPKVARIFASRFNKLIRTDRRRNDGSLRRWIGSQPGVKVDEAGGNLWTVFLEWCDEDEATMAPVHEWAQPRGRWR